MMGKKGRILSSGGFTIDLANYREADPISFLKKYDAFLSTLAGELTEADSDLKNILDEMKSVVNQTQYLLSLNK